MCIGTVSGRGRSRSAEAEGWRRRSLGSGVISSQGEPLRGSAEAGDPGENRYCFGGEGEGPGLPGKRFLDRPTTFPAGERRCTGRRVPDERGEKHGQIVRSSRGLTHSFRGQKGGSKGRLTPSGVAVFVPSSRPLAAARMPPFFCFWADGPDSRSPFRRRVDGR